MDIPTHEQLVERYEDFCRRHDMAETRFGRDATGEPQLIQSIRVGRSPGLKTLQRVAAFMSDHEARIAADAQAKAEWPVSSAGIATAVSGGSGEAVGGGNQGEISAAAEAA